MYKRNRNGSNRRVSLAMTAASRSGLIATSIIALSMQPRFHALISVLTSAESPPQSPPGRGCRLLIPHPPAPPKFQTGSPAIFPSQNDRAVLAVGMKSTHSFLSDKRLSPPAQPPVLPGIRVSTPSRPAPHSCALRSTSKSHPGSLATRALDPHHSAQFPAGFFLRSPANENCRHPRIPSQVVAPGGCRSSSSLPR